MGILNVTPDSFSDGGKFLDAGRALAHAQKMLEQGADIIDVGGESSGPGSTNVPIQEELRRVIPVVKKIHAQFPRAVISVDTYKAQVASEAIHAGAKMINDITALRGDQAMAEVVAESGVKIVLMYSKDKTARPSESSATALLPRCYIGASLRTTRVKKHYRDVVKTIAKFLEQRINLARKAGIKREQIIIDPGMGAFVSGDQKYSFEILRRLAEFKKLGFPILVGASRKSFLSDNVGLLRAHSASAKPNENLASPVRVQAERKIKERLIPTLLAHMVSVLNGADIIRVHDVAEHVRLLRLIQDR